MAERIVNEIIVDTAKASKALADLSKKFNRYSKDLIETAKAEDKASASAVKARVFFDRLAGSTSKAAKTQKDLTASTKAATAASRKNTEQNKKQKKSADDLGISWTSVKRIFAGQIIFRALSAITNQMRDSVGVAQELEIKLAEAITIAPGKLNLSIEGFKSLRKEVRLLSESFGIDQVELATAAYQVYSNQIGDATESTKFLEQAVLLAKATVTSTANAVDILSGIINAYGLEAGEAARISDILTKSVELGRFRIDDIANSFGRLTPIASQLEISIEELFAAFDTLTIKGVSPDKAITQLLAVMLKLIKPSNAMSKALGQIGFTNIKTATSTLGLVGTLKALIATTDGTIESLGRLFPRVRAIQGILSLAGDEGKRFDSIFKEIQNTAEGATKKFADFILATEAEEFKRNIQTIKNFFVEEFGKNVIKTANDILEALGGIPGAVEKLGTAFAILEVAFVVLTINTILSTAAVELFFLEILTATSVTVGFSAAIGAIPFAALVIGAAAAGQVLAFLVNQFILGGAEASRLAAEQKALERSTKELATVVANSAGIGLDAVRDAANAQLDAVVDSIREQIIAYEEQGSRIKFLGQEVTQDLISELERRLDSFQEFADDSSTALIDAARKVESIDKSIARIEARSEQALFDQRIKNFSKLGQRRAKDARVRDLIARSRLAATVEERNQLLRTAETQARGGRLAKIATDARLKGLELEKTEIQKAAVILDRMSPTINKAVGEMKRLTDEAKAFGAAVSEAVEKLDFSQATLKFGLLEDVVKEFEGVQGKIESLLGNAFEQSLTPLREGVRNIFSDPMPLSFKLEQARKEIDSLFKDREVPIDIILKAGQLGIDVKDATFESILKGIGLSRDQVDTGLASVKGLLVTGVVRTVEEANLEIQKQLAAKEVVFAGSAGIVIPSVDPETLASLTSLAAVITAVQEALAVDKGEEILLRKLDTVLKVASTLTPQLKQLKEQGLDKAVDSFEELIKKIQRIDSEVNKARGISELENDVKGAIEKFRTLNQVLPSAEQSLKNIGTTAEPVLIRVNALGNETSNIGPKAQTGAAQAVSALQTIGPAAGNQIAQVNALAASLANLASQRAAAATVATGGQIPAFLAAGGPTQSRGTDTVSVQAAPGEFFVNAASSRRFIPELTAINQGRAPEPRNNSQTTNNSFSGDININVPAGTKIDGRAVAGDIRRELRRKTSSLS